MNLKDQNYQYSYKGFAFWVVLFILSYIVLMLLPLDEKYLTYLVLLVTAWDIVLLTFMIYKNEYIYWYNGIDYEEAKKAGSDKRKQYAYKHFILFLKASLLYSVLSVIMIVFNISYFISILILVIMFIFTAIKSINIKL